MGKDVKVIMANFVLTLLFFLIMLNVFKKTQPKNLQNKRNLFKLFYSYSFQTSFEFIIAIVN
jgi:hypothetical protein